MFVGAALQNASGFTPRDVAAGFGSQSSLAVGSDVAAGAYARSDTICFSTHFTGLDGQGGGLIYEQGGTGDGMYIGFRENGTFIARAGSGAELPNNAAAAIQLPVGTIQGDGRLDVLVIMDSHIQLSVYWNGWKQADSVETIDSNANWAGTASGVFLKEHSGSNVPKFEVHDRIPSFGSAGSLSVYQ